MGFNQQDFQSPLNVLNEAASEAPPHAALQVTGYETGTGAVKVTRPTTAGQDPRQIIFNTGSPIAEGAYGQAVRAVPCLAYFSGSPAVGDDVGTAADQWYLTTGQTGFMAWSALMDDVVIVNVGCGC